MSKNHYNSHIHYNTQVRQMTIDMFLAGRSHFEIKKAIREFSRRIRRS